MRPLKLLASRTPNDYTKYIYNFDFSTPYNGDIAKFLKGHVTPDHKSGSQNHYNSKDVIPYLQDKGCIRRLEEFYKNKTKKNPVWSNFNALTSIREGWLGSDYPKARFNLQADIGRYCSYCDEPVLQSIEVEHVLPKSTFPSFTVYYDNFYFACKRCNIMKGALPPYKDIYDEMVAQKLSPTKDNILKASASVRVWPINVHAFDAFDYAINLQPAAPKQQRPIDFLSENWHNVTYKIAAGTNDLYLEVKIKTATYQLRVLINPTTIAGSAATCKMLDFNETRNKMTEEDRLALTRTRLINRTSAFLDFLAYLNAYANVVKVSGTRLASRQSAFVALAKSVATTGFITLWFHILPHVDLKYYSAPGKTVSLLDACRTYFQDRLENKFPSTNWDALPGKYIKGLF